MGSFRNESAHEARSAQRDLRSRRTRSIHHHSPHGPPHCRRDVAMNSGSHSPREHHDLRQLVPRTSSAGGSGKAVALIPEGIGPGCRVDEGQGSGSALHQPPLGAAVYFCSANVSATLRARAAVLACAMFDATATTIPLSRRVVSDITLPPASSPSSCLHSSPGQSGREIGRRGINAIFPAQHARSRIVTTSLHPNPSAQTTIFPGPPPMPRTAIETPGRLLLRDGRAHHRPRAIGGGRQLWRGCRRADRRHARSLREEGRLYLDRINREKCRERGNESADRHCGAPGPGRQPAPRGPHAEDDRGKHEQESDDGPARRV